MITILLHRLLQSFVLPPLNSLVIILLGVFFFKPQKLIGKIFILFGCVSLYLQATPYFAYELNRLITPAIMKVSALKQAQAIVILGGGVNNNANEYSANAVSGADAFIRLRYAAYLAKKDSDLPIFVSGGAIDTKDSEASLMKKSLVDEFDVENPIYLEPDSKTTAENAKYTARLLQQYGVSQVVLVTSASHMKRAQALFELNGIKVIPAPTGFYSLGYYNIPLLWFVPSAQAMVTTSAVLHEIYGYVYDLGI
jgi:uncharacterized SAM-binding protein YcdF (DUF218 family)